MNNKPKSVKTKLFLYHTIYTMKKWDKEYSTQYLPERNYLLKHNIRPSFVKVENEITTYKYTKTPELFQALVSFYMENK